MKRNILSLACLAAVLFSCTCNDIIQDNVRNAEKQLASLIEASEANDTIRIPSTFKNGEIEFVPVDDWVSGFFAGTLWYMYELTGKEEYAVHAQKHTEVLHEIQFLKWHHDVGFMVYDSYGNGLRLKHIPGYDTVLVNTAKSLATRFRPNAGIIQSWNVVGDCWQAQRGWKCPVIIDNMMNLELLFKVSEMTGDPTYRNIAISHADKTMENHYREDMSTYHVVDYDDETGEVRRRCTAQGIADESRWARGQAWSIYGFTVAYRFTGDERYLDHAKKVAEYLLVNEDNMPEDMVPLWDFDAVEFAKVYPEYEKYVDQRDASSAAIIASALYELWWYTREDLYIKSADKMIESLSKAPYRAEIGTNGGFILKHSVGSIPHGGNIDVPLNYADYYLLEALIRKRHIQNGEKPVEL